MASDTRDRIVDTARQLFWERGYQSTSLAQIAEVARANPGSIYYFFPSKSAILDAVLEHYEEQLGAWLIEPVFARTADPLERVFGVVDTYRAFLVETRFSLGCPVGSLAIEIDDDLVDARRRITAIFEALTATLTSCAAELVDDLPPDAPAAETLAALVMTVIEGGIVQARAARSIDPFDRSVDALRDYLARLLSRGAALAPRGVES